VSAFSCDEFWWTMKLARRLGTSRPHVRCQDRLSATRLEAWTLTIFSYIFQSLIWMTLWKLSFVALRWELRIVLKIVSKLLEFVNVISKIVSELLTYADYIVWCLGTKFRQSWLTRQHFWHLFGTYPVRFSAKIQNVLSIFLICFQYLQSKDWMAPLNKPRQLSFKYFPIKCSLMKTKVWVLF
jgi:hypothetical protein